MFEIYQSEGSGKYHFRLKAGNGEIILTGQGYQAKADCLNGIESVRSNASNAEAFHFHEAKDGRHYFTLKAANGQVIGQSQMYKSGSGQKNGVSSIQQNAPDAETKDLTS